MSRRRSRKPFVWSKSADETLPASNGFMCGLGRLQQEHYEHEYQYRRN